jgi:hypothetical protein
VLLDRYPGSGTATTSLQTLRLLMQLVAEPLRSLQASISFICESRGRRSRGDTLGYPAQQAGPDSRGPPRRSADPGRHRTRRRSQDRITLDMASEHGEVPGVGDLFFVYAYHKYVARIVIYSQDYLSTLPFDTTGKPLAWIHARRRCGTDSTAGTLPNARSIGLGAQSSADQWRGSGFASGLGPESTLGRS